MTTFEEFKEIMKDNPRYKHSMGVVKMALKLNEYYHLGVDEEKIKLAGISHDITKNISNEENLELLKKEYHEKLDPELLNAPQIWHAITGMITVRDKYHINDLEILNAIFYHTTGKPNMTNLEKLIFLSDFIEETRVGTQFEMVREIAFKNMDEAIVAMYENEFSYITSKNQTIYHLSLEAYNYYKKEVEND